jgi:hypothetical protein
VISQEDQTRITEVVHHDWLLEVQTEQFIAICAGKERGHRIADHAEERTLSFLERAAFDLAYEHGISGLRRARSMGDVWLRSGEPPIFNPVNVKAGIAGVGGQPNMVSLAKLTDALLKHRIDSYWLLLIRIEQSDAGLVPYVKLVNILDYLRFMHFDSGPGQMMLRSDAFYAYVASEGAPERLSKGDAVRRLIEMRRDGDRRLIANRARGLERLEGAFERFDPSGAIDQTKLPLQRPTP